MRRVLGLTALRAALLGVLACSAHEPPDPPPLADVSGLYASRRASADLVETRLEALYVLPRGATSEPP